MCCNCDLLTGTCTHPYIMPCMHCMCLHLCRLYGMHAAHIHAKVLGELNMQPEEPGVFSQNPALLRLVHFLTFLNAHFPLEEGGERDQNNRTTAHFA